MRRIGIAAAALLLQATLAGAAMAQDGFVWIYDRYLDPDPFQTRLSLVYAIPETDAVQFIATCRIGAGGTYATIELGADIGSLAEGAPVDVRILGSNYRDVITGDVIGVGAEVGLTGVSLAVELDDPIWQAMQTSLELAYTAGERTDHSLGLNGAADPVARFVTDCRDMPEPGDVAAQPQPAPPPPTAQVFAGCSQLGTMRTTDTGGEASITFVNRTDGFRGVLWIDGNGMPQPYGNLNPGESYTQQSFAGHIWMITDGPGNCLEVYVPAAGASVFAITAPNIDFGPE
ncbi:VHL beta domain-containing protein [Bauldia litoralis]|uniref:von Hippel-Lindau disease tumour suppressor protein n=1 Tax=Bauldia litoralis TaxID=665467 RepID=A0A1G6BYP9_9HYPH|nr:hypothetical protein [Bauldia litoralis]SDB25729.1 von Hippel-Lindau disease tumour suppressor protein [Bauldia litoralis]